MSRGLHREAGLSFSPQHTVAASTAFSGVGIHSGQPVAVEVRPAAAGAGIVFLRTDETVRDPLVPARAEAVADTRLGTTIANAAGVSVATVEHLMAALAGLEIDNAVVAIDGPEAPIMDGSAAPFVRALEAAGRRPQGLRRQFIEVLETVEAAEGDKFARLLPADGFEMAFEIAFDDAAIGRQSLDLCLDRAVFRRELADCRTFGFRSDVDALRAAGLARGGSLDNVVVIDGGAPCSMPRACAGPTSSCGTRCWTPWATSICSARRSSAVTRPGIPVTPSTTLSPGLCSRDREPGVLPMRLGNWPGRCDLFRSAGFQPHLAGKSGLEARAPEE